VVKQRRLRCVGSAAELLRQVPPDVAGIYVNTVNCLSGLRALEAAGGGKVEVDHPRHLFAEMSRVSHKEPHSVYYPRLHRSRGRLAVRVMVDISRTGDFPPRSFYPGVVMASNLHRSGKCDWRKQLGTTSLRDVGRCLVAEWGVRRDC